MKKSNVLKLKTYTLYAKDKVSGDYIFILSVDANNLKSAREFAQKHAFDLHRKFPYYHYDFIWEQENV